MYSFEKIAFQKNIYLKLLLICGILNIVMHLGNLRASWDWWPHFNTEKNRKGAAHNVRKEQWYIETSGKLKGSYLTCQLVENQEEVNELAREWPPRHRAATDDLGEQWNSSEFSTFYVLLYERWESPNPLIQTVPPKHSMINATAIPLWDTVKLDGDAITVERATLPGHHPQHYMLSVGHAIAHTLTHEFNKHPYKSPF